MCVKRNSIFLFCDGLRIKIRAMGMRYYGIYLWTKRGIMGTNYILQRIVGSLH